MANPTLRWRSRFKTASPARGGCWNTTFEVDRATKEEECCRNFNTTAIGEPRRDSSGGVCGSGLVVDGLKKNCLGAVSGKKRLIDGLFGIVVDWDFVGMSEEGLGLLLISENIEGETRKRRDSLEKREKIKVGLGF